MATLIERPLFYEGQILGARDLTSAVEHGRGQLARHNRFLHTWGIANGLELSKKNKKTSTGVDYQEVTLSAGVAVTGTGREVVVPESQRLSEDLFDQLNVAISDPDALYPVFLIGRDEAPVQGSVASGACNSSQAARSSEGYEVTFGQPGDELELDKQPTGAVTDGAGSGDWRILLGFVTWDSTINKFKAFKIESNGIGRRYAGVQADEVIARGGSLTLRSRPGDQGGKPSLIMDETNGGELRFGLQNASGVITPVFTVNSKGDVTAEGKISGAVTPGSVQLQSGIATDGVLVPLPPGITEEQVSQGHVILHVHVTPRNPGAAPPNANTDWVAVPIECRVDGSRRVLCRARWFRLSLPGVFQDRPGACDYVVLASVPAT
jgi:hypothetical protein